VVARVRAARYSIVTGSPPLNPFITVSIPDAMNIRCQLKLLIAAC
jgi:hypothetical protein